MNQTIDLTAVPILAVAALVAIQLFAAVGVVYIGERIFMGYRGEMRHRRVEEPEPATPAEPVAEPEPVVEVTVMRTADLLPPPPPLPEDVPLFRSTPVPLPAYQSYGFRWTLPADPFPTGALPVVELRDDVDMYQVSEVPPAQLPGFEVEPSARRRFSRAKVDLDAGTVVVA